MQILWVSPTASHSPTMGDCEHIISLGQCLLAAGHSVTFLLQNREASVNQEDLELMRSFWTDVVVVPHRLNNPRKSLGSHWGIDDWFNKDLAASIHILTLHKSFDIVISEGVAFSQALTLFGKKTFKILNRRGHKNIFNNYFRTTTEQEKIALNRADLILVSQDNEYSHLKSITTKPMAILGHTVDAAPILSNQRKTEILRIGCFGPNSEIQKSAVQTLTSEITRRPSLKGRVELFLGGDICECADVLDLHSDNFLTCTAPESDFLTQIDLLIHLVDTNEGNALCLSSLYRGVPFLSTSAANLICQATAPAHRCVDIRSLVDHLEVVSSEPSHHLPIIQNAGTVALEGYQMRLMQQVSELLRAIATQSTKHLRRQRVLMVTDIPFWEPGTGSHSRILSTYFALAAEFDCDVFFYGSIGQSRAADIQRAGIRSKVISYKLLEEPAKKVKFTSSIPAHKGIKRGQHDIFGATLGIFLKESSPYDAIAFEYVWMAYLVDAIPYKTTTILDTHDLMALREYVVTTQGLTAGVSLTLKEEVNILSRFDVVIGIQREETKRLTPLLPSSIVVCCPHGVDNSTTKIKPPSTSLSRPVRLGFIGGYSQENRAAIAWFVTEVWPIVARTNVELHVYGKVCELIQRNEHWNNINLHGLIASPADAYAHCDIMINPIMHGGGLKIKSVEALMYGRPLISSPEGAIGIDTPEKSGIILARNRGEFIDTSLLLIHSPDLRKVMAQQALTAAKEQFSSSVSFAPLIELIRSL